MPTKNVRVFAGSSSRSFAQKICDYLGIELGESEVIKFSEGNTFVKVEETVDNKDVYLIQSIGLQPNDEFVEILFWIDAFKRAGARSVTLVMPYFSYAKGDKKDEPRVSIRARVCAESIELAGADRIITMDLHSPQIQGFFKQPVDNLFAYPLLCEYVKRMDLNMDNLVVVAPDSGFAKQARKFESYLGCSMAIGDKIRKNHDEQAEVLEIIGDVQGKDCLVVDDFSITGGTIIDITRGLKQRGANRIFACLSHVLLQEKGVERIEASPVELLISSDTVNNNWIAESEKIKLISMAPLFAEAMLKVITGQSVSALFDRVPPKVLKNSLRLAETKDNL